MELTLVFTEFIAIGVFPFSHHDLRPYQGGRKVWLHPLLANQGMMSERIESSLKKRVNADVFSELTV
jgi:hypothetical protein